VIQKNQPQSQFRTSYYSFYGGRPQQASYQNQQKDPNTMDVDNLYFDETNEVEEDTYEEIYDDQTDDQVEEEQVKQNDELNELCMQLNVVMTPLQCQCFTAGQCLKCGKTRHFAKQCNVKPGRQPGFKQTNPQP
jgi:hypothetical protein